MSYLIIKIRGKKHVQVRNCLIHVRIVRLKNSLEPQINPWSHHHLTKTQTKKVWMETHGTKPFKSRTKSCKTIHFWWQGLQYLIKVQVCWSLMTSITWLPWKKPEKTRHEEAKTQHLGVIMGFKAGAICLLICGGMKCLLLIRLRPHQG